MAEGDPLSQQMSGDALRQMTHYPPDPRAEDLARRLQQTGANFYETWFGPAERLGRATMAGDPLEIGDAFSVATWATGGRMPFAKPGTLGAGGGKPFWESMKGVRMSPMEATRRDVLDKLIANGDFEPTLREGRLWFNSLSPAENEEMNRIGWGRAPDVTFEQETGPQTRTSRAAWERNIRHWRDLASPGQPATGLTPEHVRWASQHDWFVGDNGDGTIMVLDRWSDRNGQYHKEVIPFTGTIDELRRWAGY